MSEIIRRPGQFVWREIMTPDPERSQRFYGELFGWKANTTTMPDGTEYTMLEAAGKPIGGCVKLPQPEIPPHWMVCISTEDVDATAERTTAAGGRVLAGPLDVGPAGRFAALADAQGAAFSVFCSATGDGARAPDDRPGVGEFCWEQLDTTDPRGAAAFYADVFGWTETPFPGGGDLDVFKCGDVEVASRMQAPPGVPAHWLSYVVVDSLEGALARATRSGGTILAERIEVPTLGLIGVIQDDVGATLGLFQPAAQ